MLSFKVIFQSLDRKYFLVYFTWNFSCIHAKSAISQQVVYSSFQSNILVRKLTLLPFAHVCVNLYKIYESHRERSSKLAVKDVRKKFINNQLELRAQISSRIDKVYIVLFLIIES